MSLRDGGLGEIKPPLVWVAALALVIAVVVAAALFMGDRRGDVRGAASSVTRRVADSVTAPVGGLMSAPVRWIGAATGWVGGYFDAGGQNATLKRQLVAAGSWRDRALALQEENDRLRSLLGARTNPPLPMVFANTVIDARGPFANTRLADAGAARGIVEGNPVLSARGLVGRVTGVADQVSRIMLLTDVDSRTPVLIARTNGRAILTGDGGPNPSLAYLRTHDALQAGDRVLTSGDGGVLPRGLPVGSAVMGFDGVWRVALDSDAAAIDFVQILLFKDFSQLVPIAALAPTVLPSTRTDAPDHPAAPPVTLPAAAKP